MLRMLRFPAFLALLFAFSLNLSAQQQLAALHPGSALIWQRTSPSPQKPDGPVLYTLIFRSSATPGNIPVVSPQFTLANSHIVDNGSMVTISEPVNFAGGQSFPGVLSLSGGTMTGNIIFAGTQTFPGTGTITSVTAGTGLSGGGASGPITLNNTGVLGVAAANSTVTVGGTASNPTVAVGTINAANIAGSQVVKNVNGLFDTVTLAVGTGLSLTPSGQTLTLANTGQVAPAWGLTGTAGTVDGTNFLGTTDNTALNIYVNGQRAWRIVPATDGQLGFVGYSPNVIGGFSGNAVNPNASNQATAGATIGGGGSGSRPNTVSATWGTVAGGALNTASAPEATVGGGSSNTASGNHATVAGGFNGQATATDATLGGGNFNSVSAIRATVAGGNFNTASGPNATVSGGSSNTASGSAATVAGGQNNTASGAGSFAAGQYTTDFDGINHHNGVFLWGDNSTTTNLTATAENQFLIRAVGGVGIGTGSPSAQLHVASGSTPGPQVEIDQTTSDTLVDLRLFTVGSTAWDIDAGCITGTCLLKFVNGGTPIMALNPSSLRAIDTFTGAFLSSAGMWTNSSDRNLKHAFRAVDTEQVLARVAAMPITTWSYKKEDARIRHLGPMAQDFYAAFQVGDDDKHIGEIDEGGVALAAIQGLNQKLESSVAALRSDLREKDGQIAALRTEAGKKDKQLTDQQAEIVALRQALNSIRAQVAELKHASRQQLAMK